MGEQNVYPGPVDNSGLLRGKKDKAWKINPRLTFIHSVKNMVPMYPIAQSKWGQKQTLLTGSKEEPIWGRGGGGTLQHTFVFFTHWHKCCPNYF